MAEVVDQLDEDTLAKPTAEYLARSTCPKCGGRSVPIVYGYPTEDVEARARRGEVALGGCLVTPDNPTHVCPACRFEFGSPQQHEARRGT